MKADADAVVPYTYNVTFDMDFDTIVSAVVDGEPVLTETGKVFKMNVRSKVAAAVGLPIGNVQVRAGSRLLVDCSTGRLQLCASPASCQLPSGCAPKPQ